MPAFCLACNTLIDETKDVVERQPCPSCGSLKRRHEEMLTDRVVVGELLCSKAYEGGLSKKKGLRFESKDGDSYSGSLNRFVKLNQFVDHQGNRYIKKVVDPVTRRVLRDVDEPLSEHQGRGSAKARDP